MKLLQFGAGNIGRSFIGQIFSRAAWDVVFIDVKQELIQMLNDRRYYTVVIKREGQADEVRRIGPVRAVDGRDIEAIAGEITGANLAAVSVGKNALPSVLPILARGLSLRSFPLDIIIAENDREAPALFRSVLFNELGPAYPLDTLVGLVETSIGKMVPIMKEADLAVDSLQLFAEEYETLIVDKIAFKNPLPAIPELFPVDPIAAYVDRKLFIHNLGHATAAYLGYTEALTQKNSQSLNTFTIPEALALPKVEKKVRRVMSQAADALVKEYPQLKYPGVYNREDLQSHIEDLLYRFKNSALGDTVHRVGRDLKRKLSREDRIIGAMILCAKHGLPFGEIAQVYRCALEFAAPAENGKIFPADTEFHKKYQTDKSDRIMLERTSAEKIFMEVSGLDNIKDSLVIKEIMDNNYIK